MSRWSDRFHALTGGRDTVDSVDTVGGGILETGPRIGPLPAPDTVDTSALQPTRDGASVNCVNSVTRLDDGGRADTGPPQSGQVSTVSTVSAMVEKEPCADSIDLGLLPVAACPTCGRGLWWRLSGVERGGPGLWTCSRCAPSDPARWIDGHAVPSSAPWRPS